MLGVGDAAQVDVNTIGAQTRRHLEGIAAVVARTGQDQHARGLVRGIGEHRARDSGACRPRALHQWRTGREGRRFDRPNRRRPQQGLHA